MSCSAWSTTKSLSQHRAQHERRDACSGAPLVVWARDAADGAGRRHVIPLAAELVVGDDDHRVLRAGAALDRLQQVDESGAPGGLGGVAGMLVLLAERLDEADRLEVALLVRSLDGVDEGGFVLQMVGARLRPGRVVREVVERLMVELEVAVGAGRDGRRSIGGPDPSTSARCRSSNPARRRHRPRSTSRRSTTPSPPSLRKARRRCSASSAAAAVASPPYRANTAGRTAASC